MKLLTEPATAAPVDCPYLPDRAFVQDYFFATELDEHEFDILLENGWRRFGQFFFRPRCPGCRSCIPLRIDTEKLQPTRSQRRVLAKGKEIQVRAVPPSPSDEAWRVYRNHSKGQFGRDVTRENFESTFFDHAVPAYQSEYRLDGRLIALGFLDIAESGYSSAYFAFDPDWAEFSPGVLSVFRESDFVRRAGGRWYYLGYWISGCRSMEYKARFSPHQILDWTTGEWRDS